MSLSVLSLCGCGLSPHSCAPLASVLSSSSLTHLDLSHNDLQDSGVELLCSGLKSAPCRLETLRLSGCLVSERGGAALASALSSAPSHLREFDLSYNHPGPSAELLTALQDQRPLLSVRLDPAGERWMVPGLRKYSCDVSLDPNSAHRRLLLSDDHRTVTRVKEDQEYPDHDDRFTDWEQVLSCTGLRGRCYWEVDWRGRVYIAVSYRGIGQSEQGWECGFGYNDQSWSLRICEDGEYFVIHNRKSRRLHRSCHSERGGVFFGRVGVFLDSEAGALSFYDVSSDEELSLLWTFSSSFSEPLFPGFGLWDQSSSVTLLTGPNMTERLKETHSPQEQPRLKISSPRLDPAGERWTVPGLRKYSCDVSLDPNSAHRRLLLSDDHHTVTRVEEDQEYPDHDDRFTDWEQVLSCTDLRGRCYWEVDWSGAVVIAVSYRKIRRSRRGLDSAFGFNDQSWTLRIWEDGQYCVIHKRKKTPLPLSCQSRREGVSSGKGGVFFGRVGVFLDSEAGELSFYDVSSDELFHLWTFSSFFSEPLFPGFGLFPGSSVTLLTGPNTTERLKETHSPQEQPRLKISSPSASKEPEARPSHHRRSQVSPRVSPVQQLKLVRSEFVQSVSDEVLKQLLDKLQQEKVLTPEEVNCTRKMSKEDKARYLLDTVIPKGEAASSFLIRVFRELDPRSDLCRKLRTEDL
ncbi:uncharacterized protein LOC129408957 isoform X1 [Boleophthalmus pectinirostris]|uniref:uncharacterized protein LOC129408957 isoform X1 n=1 Tax=Boleophthalmus pectinirostris TaxID=150288 RepID=UPI0024307CE1|nr:uncharacterized protein LOC129408957 isoform X1 [Boleophthalmus pectinirostris]